MKPDNRPCEPFFYGIFGGELPRLWALLPERTVLDANPQSGFGTVSGILYRKKRMYQQRKENKKTETRLKKKPLLQGGGAL
jgi:hypothetical protein